VPKDQRSSDEDLGQGLGGVDCAADWPTDLMIHRRGADASRAERTHKNLCELGVSAVNPTGKVKFVGQPDCAVQDPLQGADCVQRPAPRCVGYEQAEPFDTFGRAGGQPRCKPCPERSRRMDTSRAREHFGVEAQTPFEEGLRRMIEWQVQMRPA